jgi:uncharacterized membrane protein
VASIIIIAFIYSILLAQVMIPVLKNLVVNKTDENEIRQALKVSCPLTSGNQQS